MMNEEKNAPSTDREYSFYDPKAKKIISDAERCFPLNRKGVYLERGEPSLEENLLEYTKTITELLDPRSHLDLRLTNGHIHHDDSDLAREDRDGGSNGPETACILINVLRSQYQIESWSKLQRVEGQKLVYSGMVEAETDLENKEEVIREKFRKKYRDLFDTSGEIKKDTVEVRKILLKSILDNLSNLDKFVNQWPEDDFRGQLVNYLINVNSQGFDRLAGEIERNHSILIKKLQETKDTASSLRDVLETKYNQVSGSGRFITPLSECLRNIYFIKNSTVSVDPDLIRAAECGYMDDSLPGWWSDKGSSVINEAKKFIRTQEDKIETDFVDINLSPKLDSKKSMDYLFIDTEGNILTPDEIYSGQGISKKEVNRSDIRNYKNVTYHFDSLPRSVLIVKVDVTHTSDRNLLADGSIQLEILNLPKGNMNKQQWQTLKDQVKNIVDRTDNGTSRSLYLDRAFGSEEVISKVVNVLSNKVKVWMNNKKRSDYTEKLDKYGCASIKISAKQNSEPLTMSYYGPDQYMGSPTENSFMKTELS